jgi:hypothetical protein
MIGFVCAISASLTIVILITISSLLGYIDSMIPKHSLTKVSEFHYHYSMDSVFIEESALKNLTLLVNSLEVNNQLRIMSYRPGCNFGFNRSEKEMTEIATFNFIRMEQFYKNKFSIQSIKIDTYSNGINNCYVDVYFEE